MIMLLCVTASYGMSTQFDAPLMRALHDPQFDGMLVGLLTTHQPSLPSNMFPVGNRAAVKLADDFQTLKKEKGPLDGICAAVADFLAIPIRRMTQGVRSAMRDGRIVGVEKLMD